MIYERIKQCSGNEGRHTECAIVLLQRDFVATLY
jgi:hypothetical protein